MFTTRPRDAFRIGRSAWMSASGATTLTSCTRRRTSSGYSTSAGNGDAPSSEALLIRRSRRPMRRTAATRSRRRFISLLVYKMYKPLTSAPGEIRVSGVLLMASRGSFGDDDDGHQGCEGTDRWASSESAEGFVSGGSPVLRRFAGSGPRPHRADDASHRGRLRERAWAIDRGGTKRPRLRPLVRPCVRREVACDSPSGSVREDPQR